MNFLAFRGGLFAKFKIKELNSGEIFALKRSFLFFYNYISTEATLTTWDSLFYARIYCRCSSVDAAKRVIDKWIEDEHQREVDKIKKKTKRIIKYP